MQLNEEQRRLLSSKLMDLANLTIVGLVFGQIVSATGYHPSLIASGLLFYFGLSLGALRLRE